MNSEQPERQINFASDDNSMEEDETELEFGEHSPVVPMTITTSLTISQYGNNDQMTSTTTKTEENVGVPSDNTFEKNLIGSFSMDVVGSNVNGCPVQIQRELVKQDSGGSHTISYLDSICAHGFPSEQDATIHMESECKQKFFAREETLSSCPGPFSCPFCNNFFCSKPVIEAHLKTNHSLQTIHQCSTCEQTFTDINALKEHMPIHLTDERKYQCGYCGKTFKTRKDVYQHERHVHDGVARKKQKYDCGSCSRFFRTRRALFAHELLEHGAEGGLQCEHCGKKFAFDDKLKRHVDAVHLKIISHVCNDCSKGFSDSYALKSHRETVHEKKKDLLCEYCDHRFNNKRGLVRHMDRIHFDKKKFKCEMCSSDYQTYSELVDHIERTHGDAKEFKCQHCELIFPSREFRNLHTNLRHSPRLRCEKCGKYCPTEAARLQHMTSHEEGLSSSSSSSKTKTKKSKTKTGKIKKQKRWKMKLKNVADTEDDENISSPNIKITSVNIGIQVEEHKE